MSWLLETQPLMVPNIAIAFIGLASFLYILRTASLVTAWTLEVFRHFMAGKRYFDNHPL